MTPPDGETASRCRRVWQRQKPSSKRQRPSRRLCAVLLLRLPRTCVAGFSRLLRCCWSSLLVKDEGSYRALGAGPTFPVARRRVRPGLVGSGDVRRSAQPAGQTCGSRSANHRRGVAAFAEADRSSGCMAGRWTEPLVAIRRADARSDTSLGGPDRQRYGGRGARRHVSILRGVVIRLVAPRVGAQGPCVDVRKPPGGVAVVSWSSRGGCGAPAVHGEGSSGGWAHSRRSGMEAAAFSRMRET